MPKTKQKTMPVNKRSQTPKYWKHRADKLFSKIIRSKGYCEKCGRSAGVQLQTAHIISRTYSKVRTDERNAFCLCSACHRYFHNWPKEFSKFITDWRGSEVYEELKAKAEDTGKFDWESEYKRLEELWKSIESTR